MKNVLVLLMVFALIGSASAVYAPNTWGFAAPGAGNPYTFDGPDGSNLTNQTPDVWGTWGGDAQGAGDVKVSGGQCTMITNSWELAFSHDNALVDIGNPIPGVDGIEIVLTVTSVTGGGYLSIKLECFPVGVSFPNPDNGTGNIGVADFEAAGGAYLVTGPGVYSFNTADIGFSIPAGTVAVTPLMVAAGGTVTGVIDEIWIGKAGTYSTTKAFDPVPGNGEVVGSSLTELSWTNPDPNNPAEMITSDVYFLDAGLALWGNDPNMGPDVTDTGVVQIANDITAETVTIPSEFLPLDDDHYYYWAVHCTDPNGGGSVTTQGDVWYFYTGDALPVVNAGPDQFNWVAKDDGDADPTTYTITVTGTYTDDGKSPIADANFVNLGWGWDPDGADDILGNADDQRGIEKISQTWTHNGTGGTDVPPAIVAHTAGTVTAVYKTHYVEGDPANSTDIPGYWDLQLQVTDGTGTGQDVVYVRVDADCGTATANDASDNFDGYYDTNNDCVVDLADFADFAAKWLDQSVKYE